MNLQSTGNSFHSSCSKRDESHKQASCHVHHETTKQSLAVNDLKSPKFSQYLWLNIILKKISSSLLFFLSEVSLSCAGNQYMCLYRLYTLNVCRRESPSLGHTQESPIKIWQLYANLASLVFRNKNSDVADISENS